MNVLAQLEFELADYDIAVQHINHYTTGTAPIIPLRAYFTKKGFLLLLFMSGMSNFFFFFWETGYMKQGSSLGGLHEKWLFFGQAIWDKALHWVSCIR